MNIDKQEILSRLDFKSFFEGQLEGFRPAGGDEIKTRCPFHDDGQPSFYANIKTGAFFCHGCNEHGDVFSFYQRLHQVDFKTAVAELAQMVGLGNGNGEKAKTKREQARALIENCTVRYDYLDKNGDYVFSVLRFEEKGKDKNFRQWHFDFQTDRWIQNVQGVTLIPYKLNEILKADTVYVCEGEKDVDSLAALGLTATCNPQGAGKWRGEYSQWLKNKRVIILPDNDQPGQNHAEDVKKKLLPHVAGVRIVNLPDLPLKGDVTDWLSQGHTVDELLQIVSHTEEETPPTLPFSFASLDLNTLRAGRYIETKPERIRWTFTDSLPQGSLGFIVSNGGIGKSWLLLQTAMSVSTNLDCLDGIFTIGERGRAFCIFGEDVDVVVHARTQSIFNSYTMNPREGIFCDPTSRENRIAELHNNLFLLPGAGQDLRFIREESGNPVPTQTYLELLKRLKGIRDLKLVILDPVSRFYAGNENDNTLATYFCSLLERISSETGATVLISHHTNKSATNPNESSYNALFQGAIRGASGFTNAARWQMNLTTLKINEVREAGGNPAQHFNYIAGKVVKKNVGKPETRFWMERREGGVLRRFDSKLNEGGADAESKMKIIDHITDTKVQGDRMTKRQFARDYAMGFGLSVRKMETAIDELLAEGRLVIERGRNEKGRSYDYLAVENLENKNECIQDDGTAHTEYNGNSISWNSAHSAQLQRTLFNE